MDDRMPQNEVTSGRAATQQDNTRHVFSALQCSKAEPAKDKDRPAKKSSKKKGK